MPKKKLEPWQDPKSDQYDEQRVQANANFQAAEASRDDKPKRKVVKKQIRLIERFNNFQIVEGVESGIRIVSKDVSSLTDGQVVIAN